LDNFFSEIYFCDLVHFSFVPFIFQWCTDTTE